MENQGVKTVDESILFFSRVSLSKFSLEALHFVGIRVFIVVYVRNVKSQVSSKQGILATQPRDWNKLRANCLARLYIFVQ